MIRELVAEALGTALLLAVVVGSGIMGESLAGGNTAMALLANSLATGAALVVLILVFAPISGAHLNPVVTLSAAVRGELAWSRVAPYLLAQIVGAFAGVLVAHAMFGHPAIAASAHVRSGPGQLLSEAVATFGLVLTILGVERNRPAAVPFAVALFIVAAYWFTASTSFANPAVTLARAATDTFAGIRPVDVPGFVVAQLAGGGAAVIQTGWLWGPALRRVKGRVGLEPTEQAAEPAS
jgi:glycerol uptake facilitator-like aquaporin